MTEYRWSEVKAEAVLSFGGTPSEQQEERIVAAFRESPIAIIGAIKNVSEGFAAGRIRAPWVIVELQATRIAAASEWDVVVEDSGERSRRERAAAAWVRNAGFHFDREEEIVEELFGDRGSLRTWANDDELRQRMIGLWKSLSPKGERVEREAAERMAAIREKHEAIRDAMKKRREVPTLL